jgi:MFS family permease
MSKKPLFFYGWIILAISFAAMALAYGARNSFSVFYVVILNEFGWSRASTAGIFSVNVIVYGIVAPFAGALVDRFGPKRVLLVGGTILTSSIILCSRVNTVFGFYLLFGVAGAIGTSLLAYPANAAVIPHWFIRRRGMAFGIFTSGWGVSFFMTPLVQYLITTFGWRTSFIWVGLLIGVILLPLVALFSRHRPQDMDLLPDGIHPLEKAKSTLSQAHNTVKVDRKWAGVNWTLRKAMQTYQFWLIFFAFFCIFGFVENLVVVHQIALMRDVGFSKTFSASIVAFWGIMTFVGSLSGFLSDKVGRETTFTLGCLISILGLFMLLLLQKGFHSWTPYLYAIFFGLGMGLNGPVLAAALADIFQSQHFGSINGFIMLGFGLGGFVGPWFGGFVFDTTKSYSIALIVAILVTCIAFTLLWAAAPRKIRKAG